MTAETETETEVVAEETVQVAAEVEPDDCGMQDEDRGCAVKENRVDADTDILHK